MRKLLVALFALMLFGTTAKADTLEWYIRDILSHPIEDAEISISVNGGVARVISTDANGFAKFDFIDNGDTIVFAIKHTDYQIVIGTFIFNTCTDTQTIFMLPNSPPPPPPPPIGP